MIPLGEAQALVLGACQPGTPSLARIDRALGCVAADVGDGHRTGPALHELVERRVRPTGR